MAEIKAFIGSLPWSCDDNALYEEFAQHGEVSSAKVIMDRETGRSRGFGFVEMANEDEAQAAITATNGQQLDGRELRVNEARPRTDRGPR